MKTKFRIRPFFVFAIFFAMITPSLAVTGGSEVDTRFDWVAFLEIDFTKGRFTCTGSHIGDGLILTAAHCVVSTDGSKLKSITARFGRGIGTKLEANRVYVHKEYDLKKLGDTPDIAIIVIDVEHTKPAITPIEYLWRKHLRKTPGAQHFDFVPKIAAEDIRTVLRDNVYKTSSGKVSALHVGFGYTDCDPDRKNCKGSPIRPFYIGKFLTNYPGCKIPYDFSFNAYSICSSDDLDSTMTDTSIGKTGIQSGDSGGPLVVFDAANTPILVGINSFTSSAGYAGSQSLVNQIEFLKEVLVGVAHKWSINITLK